MPLGHYDNARRARGHRHGNWKGGRYIKAGYLKLRRPSHPRADSRGYVYEHVLIAERAVGKHLPRNAVVHHINGDTLDNRPANLVVCQDQSYHRLIHARADARRACGNPSWRPCCICRGFDDMTNLRRWPKGRGVTVYYHAVCMSQKRRAA